MMVAMAITGKLFIFFILAIVIDFCHFIPLSVVLTLADQNRTSVRAHFHTFVLTDQVDAWFGFEVTEVKHPNITLE